MPNSWRECQGLAWSDPLRERRSNNGASTSSSGTGKKTNSSPSPHLPFPLLSSPFFFYSLPLFVSSSSFLLLPFSLLPSSPLLPSLSELQRLVQLEAVAKASNKGRWAKDPEQKVSRKLKRMELIWFTHSLLVVLASFPFPFELAWE